MNNNLVYHASSKPNLVVIKRNISSHGKAWVYATKSKLIATLFLSRKGGDYTCQICEDDDGHCALVERYEGAFKERYQSKKGYLYVLDGSNFKADKTSYKEEVISTRDESVLKVEEISDVWTEILKYEDAGELKIYRYPNRPSSIPLDNSDLVEKVKYFKEIFGDGALNDFKLYYPELAKKHFNI